MPKKKSLKAARQLALDGDVDAALPLILEYAAAGDDGAAASAAELLAFLNRWQEMIPLAARLVANPYCVRAGNVFDDMIGLLGRAGHHTGDWQTIAQAAAAAREQLEARFATNEMQFPEVKIEGERKRLFTILDRLAEYASRRGAPPHELVRIFGTPSTPDPVSLKSALEKQTGKPPARLLDLAIAFAVDEEAIRLFADVSDPTFDQAVFVAQAFVRSKQPDRAWQAIADHAPKWSPLDNAQVAPVVLLIDEHLHPLLTPARAEQIVRMARA
jgi:hypothetical protein